MKRYPIDNLLLLVHVLGMVRIYFCYVNNQLKHNLVHLYVVKNTKDTSECKFVGKPE